jgi:hypothetical protein
MIMKKTRLLSALCAAVFSLCVVVPAEAIMISRLGGAAAYDTTLDITWTTNASLSGKDNWYDQVAWASGLEYLGFNDWRLASVSVAAGLPTGTTRSAVDCSTATELACRDNELGYMFYHNLDGMLGDNLTGTQMVGDVTLTGIQSIYWSGTEIVPGPGSAYNYLFGFENQSYSGIQDVSDMNDNDFGWAVRDGDIAAVPEPPMVFLLATGLLGLIWASRKRLA